MLAQPDNNLFGTLREALASSWHLKARPEQLPPPGDWQTWLVLAGRGFGKTRTGAEWTQDIAHSVGRIALLAPTAADARDTMVEGESGILNIAPNHFRPVYEPSKRRLTWPNGARATLFSAEDPDSLRGPQHEAAWADELGAWQNAQDMWDQLQFGLRLGTRPRCVVTTTPKPIGLIRELLNRSKEENPTVVVTRGRTRDNHGNLAPNFVAQIEARYGGTRLGRQELDGEYLEDLPGALWHRDWLDRDRVSAAPDLVRVVVAVDPAVTAHETSDETGIIAAGVDERGHVYVLSDGSGRFGPLEWASRAVAAYETHGADRIVAEVNNGGAMVEATIRMVDPTVAYKEVRASRGKITRAEPVSALYEQQKVHHVGVFHELEDQMCGFTQDFNRASSGFSPDRVDALVWAITELAVKRKLEVPVAHVGRFRNGAEHRHGWINRLTPLAAVQAGLCSPERAVREGWLTQEQIDRGRA